MVVCEKYELCFSYDGYLQDKDETIWIAELVDGTKVYADDCRYGEFDRAWSRLREYLKLHNNPIDKLYIKFRSHTELVMSRGENTVGFYFGRAAGAWFGQNTSQFFIVGTVENLNNSHICKTSKWSVPEVIKDKDGDEVRDPSQYLDNIIWD